MEEKTGNVLNVKVKNAALVKKILIQEV